MEQSLEKRIVVSFALSLLVLLAFGWLFSPSPPPAEPLPAGPAPLESEAGAAAAPEPSAPAAVAPLPAEAIAAEAAADVALETARQRAVFSNQGGVLRSLRLRDYFGAEGEPLELIDPAAGEAAGWPLALATGDAALDRTIAEALYAVDRTDGRVSFTFAADGVFVSKVFELDPERHLIQASASVSRDGRPVPFAFVWRGVFGDQSTPYAPAEANAIYLEAGSFERVAATDVEEPVAPPPTRYGGVEDRYFLAMFIAPTPRQIAATAAPLELPGGPAPALEVRVPDEGDPLTIYVGPKQQDRLAEADPTLASAIHYGFFEFLARPFLLALDWINGYVGNFGWSIMILTFLITMVFFPLRLKQQLSMLKMQKIQPQMRTLQDKYKKLKPNDPRRQEVQAEMMGLYKKHGVNPLGGCLPLLLQMPFLLAIFSLLQVAIELRRAPWISWWVDDLSSPDPIYLLPILFGATMLVSQKLMPAPADPMQARIMMLMPPMLTVMFAWSQAGLLLYWWTSTLVGTVQQYFINKYWAAAAKSKERPAEPAPAEEPEETEPPPPEDEDGEKKRRRRRKK